jgi:type VII secretion protein EccB
MRTRHEQVQAYRFLTRRIVSALLSGEPETTERPMRRLGLAVFGSTMVATLVLAAIGVYGFLRPSGGRLDNNVIVIERETGARFVFLNGTLYPVVNFTSARLIIGSPTPTVQTVSRGSLRDLPRGAPVGIPNAPDALPDPSSLVGLPWSTCSMRRTPGSATLLTHLLVGSVPAGGRQPGDSALLVSAGTGTDATLFLLWNGRRLKVPDRTVLAALDLAGATPVPVGLPLLNSIVAGPDLKISPVSGAGQPQGTIDGVAGRIGQVYRFGDQYFTLLSSGLTPISELRARLMLAKGGSVVSLSASAAGTARQVPGFEPEGFPRSLPRLYNSGSEPAMICISYRAGPSPTEPVNTIDVFDRPDDQLAAASVNLQRRSADGIRLADRVALAGGRGALVRVLPAPAAPTALTTTYLLTDQGTKYALPKANTAQAQATLGFASVTPTLVPAYLLALIPTGAALDPVQARQFVTGANASPNPSTGPASPSPSASSG